DLPGGRQAGPRRVRRRRQAHPRPVRSGGGLLRHGLAAPAAQRRLCPRRPQPLQRHRPRLRRHLREPDHRRRRHQLLDPPGDPADRRWRRDAVAAQRRAGRPALEQGLRPVHLREPRHHHHRFRHRRRPDAAAAPVVQLQPPLVRQRPDRGAGAQPAGALEQHRLGPVDRADLPALLHPEHHLPPVRRHAHSGRRISLAVPRQVPVFGAGQPAADLLTMRALSFLLFCVLGLGGSVQAYEHDKDPPREIHYAETPAAPRYQGAQEARDKSAGCNSCHTATDHATMHLNPGVVLGCTDCHGGNAAVTLAQGVGRDEPAYRKTLDQAHVQPRYPDSWHYPSSANPQASYALLNRESPEFVRFINPSDYRVAREACGACHLPIIEAAERSLMSNGAMFFEGASYNNGILPFKRSVIGETYTRDGQAAVISDPSATPDPNETAKGVLAKLFPLPPWEVVPQADVFRIFERGGRNISNLFPETGLPDSTGEIQKLEEPGRPDFRQSNRGPGTGNRIAVPVINLTKTRLNDPYMWFLGTSEQPGDYRSSGCAGCHVVYANDRDPLHSGPYAKFGNEGMTQTVDPTSPKNEPGHPLKHVFTRSTPTEQCMVCHMHQPNIFLNSMLGYTMWDYESDAPAMWPEKQKYPTDAEIRAINERNPEEAAIRGKWSDPEFLKNVSGLNPTLKDTQFADYHGHGWNFRAIFKRDRKGD